MKWHVTRGGGLDQYGKGGGAHIEWHTPPHPAATLTSTPQLTRYVPQEHIQCGGTTPTTWPAALCACRFDRQQHRYSTPAATKTAIKPRARTTCAAPRLGKRENGNLVWKRAGGGLWAPPPNNRRPCQCALGLVVVAHRGRLGLGTGLGGGGHGRHSTPMDGGACSRKGGAPWVGPAGRGRGGRARS